jgi:predicted phage-related endonuclease
VRVDPGTGTARMAVRDVAPQSIVVTNGTEQENIPARYRLYVQHYFEHADSNQK